VAQQSGNGVRDRSVKGAYVCGHCEAAFVDGSQLMRHLSSHKDGSVERLCSAPSASYKVPCRTIHVFYHYFIVDCVAALKKHLTKSLAVAKSTCSCCIILSSGCYSEAI